MIWLVGVLCKFAVITALSFSFMLLIAFALAGLSGDPTVGGAYVAALLLFGVPISLATGLISVVLLEVWK